MWGTKQRAVLLWGVAGIPILIGTIQSIGALDVGPLEERYISQWAVIGPFARWLNDREIFLEAGLGFFAADPIVYVLFFLIAAAWIAFGVTFVDSVPLRSQQREWVKVGSICFSGFLYAVLFYWVFRGIFFLDVPGIQRAAFGLLPVAVVGSLVLSWRVGPTVPSGRAAGLEAVLEEKRTRFETGFDRRLAPALEAPERLPLDPADVNEVRDERTAFEDRCERLEERIDDLRETIAAGDERVSEARQLENDVHAIDPDGALEDLEERLRDRLRALYDDRYAAFWTELESPYGRRYGKEVVNLNRFATIYLPESATDHLEDGKLFIRNIDEIRTELLRDQVPVRDAVDAFAKLEAHVYGPDGLVSHIEDREAEFERLDDELRETLDETERLVDRLGGETESVLSERYLRGVGSTPSVSEVRRAREDAVEELHECLFDSAIETLETELDRARRVHDAVDFFRLAVSTADAGREYIDLPSTFDDRESALTADLLESVRDAFVADTGRTFAVDGERRRLEFEPAEAASTVRTDGAVETNGSTGGADGEADVDTGSEADDPDEEELQYDLHHHLKRLRTGVREDAAFVEVRDDRNVTMQVDAVADMFKGDAVYEALDAFLEEQDAVDDHTVDVNGGHGHVEITADPDTGVRRCTRTLVETYKQEADL